MLAAMFYAPGDIRLEDRPVPSVKPGEVLLQVAAATTCGTDVKIYRRGHPLLFQQTPAPFGHEVTGIIAATGSGVKNFHEGDPVVVGNSVPCFACFYCRKKQYSLCENLFFLHGAYAEYLLVPERIVHFNLYPLPGKVSYLAAALTEPLACALHGIDVSGVTENDTVVILGAGPLGLLLASLARLRGAKVILTGQHTERLALGKVFGAESVIDVSGLSWTEQLDLVRSQTEDKRGADIVIEAVGKPEAWELAVKLARPGGLVTFFGGCPSGTQISLETRPLHYSELTLKGVFHHTPTYFAQALEIIGGHEVPVEALISQRVPLASLLSIFEKLLQKQGVKYALIPPAFELALL